MNAQRLRNILYVRFDGCVQVAFGCHFNRRLDRRDERLYVGGRFGFSGDCFFCGLDWRRNVDAPAPR